MSATMTLVCGCGQPTLVTMEQDRARWSIDVGCLCRIELAEEAEDDLSLGRLERLRKLIEFAWVLLSDQQRKAFELYRDEVGDGDERS